MSTARTKRTTGLASLASLALLLALVAPAAAAEPAFEMDFPAGLACADFDLHVAGYGDGPQVAREFTGRGGTVLYLSAGTGYELTFTNTLTGATLSTRSNGAVNWTTVYPDGSGKMTLMGHNVVILFPADGGPSTTLYVGRAVIGIAADGTWTLGKVAGTATDLCAALSS
jgi:hypothetical protein